MRGWRIITGINIIVAIVAINIFLGYYQFWRLDLTANRIHSLSAATRKMVKNLDDLVNIKVFLTQDLPPEVRPVAEDLKTILEEIGNLNRGKIKINYTDPNKDEAGAREARSLGIQPLQFSTIKADKFEVQSGYLGLVISYGNKQEVLPMAGDVGNLEYFLMAGIKKLLSQKIPKIAVIDSQEAETQILNQVLRKSYQIVNEAEAETIILVQPVDKLDKLKEWSNKGVIVLFGKNEVNSNLGSSKVENKELEGWLKEKGVEIEDKIVADQNSAMANFRSSGGMFLTRYPYWVMVRPENFNQQIPAVSGLNSLIIPWASPLNLNGEARELFSSSQESVAVEAGGDLQPGKEITFSGELKKRVLGAINTNKIRLAVVGNSDFIKDQFVVNSQQNLALVLNLVDYFSQDTELLEIRGKELRASPLVAVNDKIKTTIKIGNTILPIILLAISFGVFRYWRKNVNKKFGNH